MPERLIRHGIDQDRSDWRIHVCFSELTAWVFRTEEARAAIKRNRYATRNPGQPGVVGATSEGFRVPPPDIAGAFKVPLPVGTEVPPADAPISEKARAAETAALAIVNDCLAFPVKGRIVPGVAGQRAGRDIVLSTRETVQVKCDYHGGLLRGLFIQTAERNPAKLK